MKRHELCQGFLKLVFDRAGDRWSHRLLFSNDSTSPSLGVNERPLLSTMEGNSNQPWPCSPPLQDLDQQDLGGGRTALLGVGKSGQSHWSASFELESFQLRPESAAAIPEREAQALRVELACLASAAGQTGTPSSERRLSSQYRISEQVEIVGWEPGFTLRLAYQSSVFTVSPLSGVGWGTEIRVEGPTLIVAPTQPSNHPRQPTRWGYRIASS